MGNEEQAVFDGYGKFYAKKEDFQKIFGKNEKYSAKEIDAIEGFVDNLYQAAYIEHQVRGLLCRMADVRPNIKIYNNGIIPTKGELQKLKNEKTHQGALILFKSVDSDITDLKEIVFSRPALKFEDGYIPDDSEIKCLSENPEADGCLVIFEPLNEQEHSYVFTITEG